MSHVNMRVKVYLVLCFVLHRMKQTVEINSPVASTRLLASYQSLVPEDSGQTIPSVAIRRTLSGRLRISHGREQPQAGSLVAFGSEAQVRHRLRGMVRFRTRKPCLVPDITSCGVNVTAF